MGEKEYERSTGAEISQRGGYRNNRKPSYGARRVIFRARCHTKNAPNFISCFFAVLKGDSLALGSDPRCLLFFSLTYM